MNNIIHVDFRGDKQPVEPTRMQLELLRILANVKAETPRKMTVSEWCNDFSNRYFGYLLTLIIVSAIGLGWCLHSIIY